MKGPSLSIQRLTSQKKKMFEGLGSASGTGTGAPVGGAGVGTSGTSGTLETAALGNSPKNRMLSNINENESSTTENSPSNPNSDTAKIMSGSSINNNMMNMNVNMLSNTNMNSSSTTNNLFGDEWTEATTVADDEQARGPMLPSTKVLL